MTFEDLKLIEPIQRAVTKMGYLHPTPIQEKSIPIVLSGKDILGCAQTGTGKTAAFALPILQNLVKKPSRHKHHVIRALVLSPTRELAAQIGASFRDYGKFLDLRHTVIFGGVNQRSQTTALHRGVDILVATPGRLLDLMGQGHVKLRGVEILVLDEADHMLDMGFIPDVRRIISDISSDRQTLFFSATLTPRILDIAEDIVRDPERVTVSPTSSTVDTIDQRVCFVEKGDKRKLIEHFLKNPDMQRVLVFTRTKHGADKVTRHLNRADIDAHAIHGNKSQNARTRALDHFKKGRVKVLVATDIAARGIDVENVSHVFNLDMPNEPEVYVHRIGRTARASASGVAISFCSYEERSMLFRIQKLTRRNLEVIYDHPYPSSYALPLQKSKEPSKSRKKRNPANRRKNKNLNRW